MPLLLLNVSSSSKCSVFFQERIRSHKYRTLDDMEEDFVQMCRNAQMYNVEGSLVKYISCSLFLCLLSRILCAPKLCTHKCCIFFQHFHRPNKIVLMVALVWIVNVELTMELCEAPFISVWSVDIFYSSLQFSYFLQIYEDSITIQVT